jgi:MoaA/NifB/PqqE/SkfB family radical SAM enzyme
MGTYISPSKVFAHIDRLSGWQSGLKPAPVSVEWDLSNVCSLACQSCHFAHTHVAGPWATKDRDKPKGYADTGKFADPALAMRTLRDLKVAGVEAIVWSGGGEPTLHPQFEQITARAHALGLQQGLYTLGGHVGALAASIRNQFTWAVVSLDAPDADAYALEKGVPASRFIAARDGIKALVGGRCVVGVSFLLHAKNWHHTSEMLELTRGLGANYATFRPTIDTSPAHPSVCDADRSWVTDALPTLRALADEHDVEVSPVRFIEYRDWTGHAYQACRGIRLVTSITPDGRVWICPNRRGVPGSELGDLNRESFADIWARHPGQWTDFSGCRVMCRLHSVNTTLAATIDAPRRHEAFV